MKLVVTNYRNTSNFTSSHGLRGAFSNELCAVWAMEEYIYSGDPVSSHLFVAEAI